MLMWLAVFILRVIYLPFMPLRMKNKITIMSRQSDRPTVDIRLLQEELKSRNVKTVVLTKRLIKTFKGGIGYSFHMIRQMYHIATSRVIVTDGYCILFSILPKKRGQNGVQIWHALGAIKKFGYQSVGMPNGNDRRTVEIMKMYRNYDYAIAPSTITAEHFSEAFDISKDRVKILGLPRIDYLKDKSEGEREKIYKMYNRFQGKKLVLYLPTFRKDEKLDISEFIKEFPYHEYNLVIKKHWLDKADYSWAKQYGAMIPHNINTMDLLKVADKVITDYSAAAFEAAILDKELYFYIIDIDQYNKNVGTNIELRYESIGKYVYTDARELFKSFSKKYCINDVRKFCEKYISVDCKNVTNDLSDFLTSLNN